MDRQRNTFQRALSVGVVAIASGVAVVACGLGESGDSGLNADRAAYAGGIHIPTAGSGDPVLLPLSGAEQYFDTVRPPRRAVPPEHRDDTVFRVNARTVERALDYQRDLCNFAIAHAAEQAGVVCEDKTHVPQLAPDERCEASTEIQEDAKQRAEAADACWGGKPWGGVRAASVKLSVGPQAVRVVCGPRPAKQPKKTRSYHIFRLSEEDTIEDWFKPVLNPLETRTITQKPIKYVEVTHPGNGQTMTRSTYKHWGQDGVPPRDWRPYGPACWSASERKEACEGLKAYEERAIAALQEKCRETARNSVNCGTATPILLPPDKTCEVERADPDCGYRLDEVCAENNYGGKAAAICGYTFTWQTKPTTFQVRCDPRIQDTGAQTS